MFKKKKFQVGDRVRVVTVAEYGDHFCGFATAGRTGIVVSNDDSSGHIACVFPGWGGGHDLNDMFPEYRGSRDGQWVTSKALRLEPMSPFQQSVQDYIRAELNAS